MSEVRASQSETTGGWCVHGVPYGPAFRCDLCAPPPVATTAYPIYVAAGWTREDVDKIIRLLESIEYNTRRSTR